MAESKYPRRASLKPNGVVIFGEATDRVSIYIALQKALSAIPPASTERSMFAALLSSDPEIEKEVTLARIRSRFLELCRDGVICPTKGKEAEEGACYEGGVEQDRLFSISVGEFTSFLEAFGINVRTGDDLGLPSCSLTEPDVKQAVSVRVAVATPDFFAPDDDEDPLWDPEVLAMERAAEERKKSKKRKLIPGKLPRTAVGRLAIKIAWHAEVDTGRKIGPKEIMESLCELAAKDNDKDCLLCCDVSQPGQEQVKWSTDEGSERWFSREDCKKAVGTWRKSIAQQSKSAEKVVARRAYRVRLPS